eukprot:superscaffoldBa00000214_g2802
MKPRLHSKSDKGDGSVRYILSGEGAGSIFIIDETTGDIHAAKSLDRERKAQYVLHARAIDRWTNRSLEAESEFIIKVQDVNDNAPTFPDGPFSATVPEMSDVGTSVFKVTASDADDPTYGNSAKIVYSILEGQPYFSVDPKTDSYLSPYEPICDYITSRLASQASPQDPRFISETGNVATCFWFHYHIRQVLSRSGISPKLYSGHSFHIGATSTVSKQGISDHIIKILVFSRIPHQ